MANLEYLIEHELVPRLDEAIAVGKRIASALEVVAGVVDEIYTEQKEERTVPAREVTKIPSAPAPPRVPRARAQLP